jgi:hypothetical protein
VSFFIPFFVLAFGGRLMASYPGAKVHRHSRRNLGRGQTPVVSPVSITVTNSSADVMQIVSSAPVVWQKSIAATAVGATIVSQAVISTTEVQITFSGSIAAAAWTVPQAAGTSYYGGQTPAASGTF